MLYKKLEEKNHLNEDRIKTLSRITGDIIMGIIPINDFAKKLEEDAHIHQEIAKNIVTELNSRIVLLNKLSLDNNKDYKIAHPDGESLSTINPIQQTPEPVMEIPQVPVQPAHNLEQQATQEPNQINPIEEKIKNIPPTIQTNTEQQETPAPFIIHKDSSIDRVEPPAGEENLLRPYFYKPAPTTQSTGEQAPARLEIGNLPNEEPIENDKTGRTEIPKANKVNYTRPVVASDPFNRMGTEKIDEIKKDKKQIGSVPPDNIVDLKDLPK